MTFGPPGSVEALAASELSPSGIFSSALMCDSFRPQPSRIRGGPHCSSRVRHSARCKARRLSSASIGNTRAHGVRLRPPPSAVRQYDTAILCLVANLLDGISPIAQSGPRRPCCIRQPASRLDQRIERCAIVLTQHLDHQRQLGSAARGAVGRPWFRLGSDAGPLRLFGGCFLRRRSKTNRGFRVVFYSARITACARDHEAEPVPVHFAPDRHPRLRSSLPSEFARDEARPGLRRSGLPHPLRRNRDAIFPGGGLREHDRSTDGKRPARRGWDRGRSAGEDAEPGQYRPLVRRDVEIRESEGAALMAPSPSRGGWGMAKNRARLSCSRVLTPRAPATLWLQ
jgi:hypothetical protein